MTNKTQKQYIAWIKGSFYPITVYAINKKEAKEKIKESYGRNPYFLEINY